MIRAYGPTKYLPIWDLNPWPLRYRCSALPTEITSQLSPKKPVGSLAQLVERRTGIRVRRSTNATTGIRGRRFKSRTALNFIQVLFLTTSSVVFLGARIS